MPYDSDQLDNLDDELDALSTPTSLDVLLHSRDYDAGIVAATAVRRAIESVGGGGPPTGNAGGVLGGTYPNPSFAADMATQSELDAVQATAAAAVPNALFDANTVLAATTDNTPAAVTMAASTILARLAAGNIKAASVAEIITLLQAYSVGGTDVAVADGGTGSSTAAGALTNLGAAPALLVENVQTGSYGLVLADANLCVVMNVGSGNNLTVPLNATQAFATGTVIAIHQRGAGQTTVVATGGVTINSPSGKLKLTGQYSSAALRKYGSDTWVLAGDLSA